MTGCGLAGPRWDVAEVGVSSDDGHGRTYWKQIYQLTFQRRLFVIPLVCRMMIQLKTDIPGELGDDDGDKMARSYHNQLDILLWQMEVHPESDHGT